MSYAQRSAERRRQDAERRAAQKQEPISRDPFYDLPTAERRRIRRAEAQGQVEGAQRAAIEAEAKRRAEYDALLPHERRPRNVWRDLIAQWQGQEYRPEIRRKLEKYRIEADKEDLRIDAQLAEAKRKYGIDNNPEVIRARAHLESARTGAEPPEQTELARLSGILSVGQTVGYWNGVAELMAARLRRVQVQIAEHAERQAPLAEEARLLAEKEKAAEELQVKPAPVEAGEPTQSQGEKS